MSIIIRTVSVTCTTTAYEDGDVIQGPLVIEDVISHACPYPILRQIMVYDTSSACPEIDFLFFNEALSSDVTDLVDNAIVAIADADLHKIIAAASATDGELFDTNQIKLAKNLNVRVWSAAGPSGAGSSNNDINFAAIARGASVADWPGATFRFVFDDRD